MSVISLSDATDPDVYGGKAVQLGKALRAGLPVPAGFAMSCGVVEAIAAGAVDSVTALTDLWMLDRPQAVRSSAVGEDSEVASFAGAHVTVLGVRGATALLEAVRQVHASGVDAGARAYRARLRLDQASLMAVVVQELIEPEVAGVLFTRNPLTGAADVVIEASWGLGEAVVSGLVTPDHYVLNRAGELQDMVLGEKDVAIRGAREGTAEVAVPEHLIGAPCLHSSQLAALHDLATACDAVFGSTEHDIEFAFRAEDVFMLQRRAITCG